MTRREAQCHSEQELVCGKSFNNTLTLECERKRTKRHAKDSGSAEEKRVVVVVKLIIQKYSSSGSSSLGSR